MSVTESAFLRGLPSEDVSELLAMGTPRAVPGGSVLFSLGEEAENLYLVTQGRVSLTLPMRFGHEQGDVLVEERLAGQVLGWSGLIPPHRYTLQAVSPEDSELLVFPRGDLLDHLSNRPEVGYRVVSNLAQTIGERLQLFQAIWAREMQRAVESRGG